MLNLYSVIPLVLSGIFGVIGILFMKNKRIRITFGWIDLIFLIIGLFLIIK